MMQLETALATVERKSEHFLEVRFKHGAFIDLPGVLAVQQARERLCPGGGCVVLTLVPPDIGFERGLMQTEMYRPNEGQRHALAEAIVTPGNLHHMIGLLYVSLFPRSFRIEVFSSEASARAWLAGRLKEAGFVPDGDPSPPALRT
jgi:hypothetical protein